MISLWASLFSFFDLFTFPLPFFLLPISLSLSLSLSLSPCLPVSFLLIELEPFQLPSSITLHDTCVITLTPSHFPQLSFPPSMSSVKLSPYRTDTDN